MSLSWAYPLGFAAFAALLLPVLLHLDRRRSQRLHTFAALRWLGDRHRPRRTWRLTEWLLLALRLALLAAIAAWLAHPIIEGHVRPAQRWIAVWPGASIDDVSGDDDDHVVWLTDGFPAVASAKPAATRNAASLLRELDARLGPNDTLAVRVPREIDGLDAMAIVLTHAVEWQITDGRSNAATAPAPPSHALALRYDDPANPSLRYVRAALASWKRSERLAVAVDDAVAGTPVPANADAVLQLGAAPDANVLSRVSEGARLLQIPTMHVDGQASDWPPAFARVDRGSRAQLSGPLVPGAVEALQSADFPAQLHRVLFAGDATPPQRAVASDVRPTAREGAAAPAHDSLRPALAWLIAGLFLLERILANGRRLARAA